MHILLKVGLALIMGCGTARQMDEGLAPAREITTLLIVNEGMGTLRVYDDMGRIATVMSGRATCVEIISPDRNVSLSFNLVGASQRFYSPLQSFSGINGWVWWIDYYLGVYSTTKLRPHDVCVPGGEGFVRDVRR